PGLQILARPSTLRQSLPTSLRPTLASVSSRVDESLCTRPPWEPGGCCWPSRALQPPGTRDFLSGFASRHQRRCRDAGTSALTWPSQLELDDIRRTPSASECQVEGVLSSS